MTYDQAVAFSLTVPWKISLCNQGEKCWCRIIEPEEEIKDKDNNDIYIVASGCITTLHAEYLIKLHNQSLLDAHAATTTYDKLYSLAGFIYNYRTPDLKFKFEIHNVVKELAAKLLPHTSYGKV